MIKDVNGRFDYYSISTRIRLLFTLGLWINWKKLVMVCFLLKKRAIIGLMDKNYYKQQMIDTIFVEEKKKLVNIIL